MYTRSRWRHWRALAAEPAAAKAAAAGARLQSDDKVFWRWRTRRAFIYKISLSDFAGFFACVHVLLREKYVCVRVCVCVRTE